MNVKYVSFGLNGHELREIFENEFKQAMRVEGAGPTVAAVAHSFARVLEIDHLRMVEQLAAAGVEIEEYLRAPDESADSGDPLPLSGETTDLARPSSTELS
jgi:hypothetical protein